MQPGIQGNDNNSIGFYCLKLLKQNKKFIIVNVTVLSLLGAGLSIIIPTTYKAHGTIMLPPEDASSYGGILGGISAITKAAGGLGGAAKSIGLKGSVQEIDIMAAIMESRTIREDVVRKCDLIAVYKMSKRFERNPAKTTDEAVRRLTKDTKINISPEEILSVDAVAPSPVIAARIVNQYFASLDDYNRNSSNTRSKILREFIGRRLVEQRLEMKTAEDSLQVYQQRHRTVSLGEEMKAAIEGSATLESKKISNQVHMDAVSKYLESDNPELVILKDENEAIQKRIDAAQHGSNQLFASFAAAPSIGMELARRYRNLKIQEEVYSLLTVQYEQAKLNETRDTPSFQLLDLATPPVKKYRPLRSLIVGGCFLLGLILGLTFSFVKENDVLIGQRWQYFLERINQAQYR